MTRHLLTVAGLAALAVSVPVHAQTPPGGGRGGGGGGPPVQGAEQDIELVAMFDRDSNGRLDREERAEARIHLAENPDLRPPARVRPRGDREGSPGRPLAPPEVTRYPEATPLYSPAALRTLFLTFEHDDWEEELQDFWHTDVEVAATLEVDGRVYPDVGVGFRGNNSFTGIRPGLKRPLKISMDFIHDQDLLGHDELKLLNANQDPTFLRSVLYMQVARDYIPALQANFVRVVINGESWGIYVNQQDFSASFVREAFGQDGVAGANPAVPTRGATADPALVGALPIGDEPASGTRWKSPNNSVGGGLGYLGDDLAEYRKWYEMKGEDDLEAWQALIDLTRIIDETPVEELEEALEPVMAIDSVLRFLALDVALVNGDGYWRDGSDFNIYRDMAGRFHLTPHDANEGFRAGGRAGASSPEPLTTLDDPNKALRRRLLAVPEFRTRYLAYVGEIADKWLDWDHLGPIIEGYRGLIAIDVEADTRKLDTSRAFDVGVYGDGVDEPSATTLRGFADQRRAYLLAQPEVVEAMRAVAAGAGGGAG